MLLKLLDNEYEYSRFVCKLTKELDSALHQDKWTSIDKPVLGNHYIMIDSTFEENRMLYIRIPGRTVGNIELNESNVITTITMYESVVKIFYDKPITDIVLKYISEKINFYTEDKNLPSIQTKYPIVTLIGSTKFKEEFESITRELTLTGHIVLNLGVFSKSDNIEIDESKKILLKDIIKEKISISDIVFVINKNYYIGKDTKEEIEYAKSLNKKIKYYEVKII